MLCFFTGVIWNPNNPSDPNQFSDDLLNNAQKGLVLDFGVVPFASGQYLFILLPQIEWIFQTQGNAGLNGTLQLADGGTTVQTINFGASQQGTAGQMLGIIEGYGHGFVATVTQGNHLYLSATGDVCLKGAQLVAIACSSIVTSPGFTN